MASVFQTMRRGWRLLPRSIRSRVHNGGLLDAMIQKGRAWAIDLSPDESVYDLEYFELMDHMARPSVETIADSIVADLQPSTAIDVGCGSGALLMALAASSVRGRGLENAPAALAMCGRRGLDVVRFDLEQDELKGLQPFDVAISTEVAEHLPAECADRFVSLLCRLSQVVVFTAAQPGQGGDDHVNEQPPAYWIKRFTHHHYAVDQSITDHWRTHWEQRGIEDFYYRNLLVFRCTR